jgi:hypothetical protein
VYAEDTQEIINQMRVRGAQVIKAQHVACCAPLTPPAVTQATLALPKDDPAQADSIARMRQLTNSVRRRAPAATTARPAWLSRAGGFADAPPAAPQWVAKYRRNGSFTGRASYGCVAQRRAQRR